MSALDTGVMFSENNYENIHNELYNKGVASKSNKEKKVKENQIKEEEKILSECPFHQKYHIQLT